MALAARSSSSRRAVASARSRSSRASAVAHPRVAGAVEGLQLGLEPGDALVEALRRVVGLRQLAAQQLELRAATLSALRGGAGLVLGPLQPEADALRGRPGGEEAPGELVALAGDRGEGLLGLRPAPGDRVEEALGLRPFAPRPGGLRLGLGQPRPRGADGVACQLVAGLVALAPEALVQLRGLGLALEGTQARAGLALDVERPREVVLGALELELGAAPALAVLAEAGGLLDQQPPLTGPREHDRLHPPLRDHRVHLLAEAGVREHLDHVGEPAPGAVEAVLALPHPVEPPDDRDLREVALHPAVGVVDHHLDLGGARTLDAVAAGEDHVLHRLPADGEGRLLAQRPEHGVGDVRLARPVGPDDHRDPRGELELGAGGEGLEALHGDRAKVHQASASMASSARSAAACSAAFLVLPSPRPISRPSTSAAATKLRSWGGPSSESIR